MRKRKEGKTVHDPEAPTSKSKTLNPIKEEEEEEEEQGIEKKVKNQQKGFFACYLLTSLCPRYKGHTYIGFTVNPHRRIRQHNGEIRCGALRTKKRRPYICFLTFMQSLPWSCILFEWAWQHPSESLAVRQAAATFKSFSGVANKIKLAYTMLNLPNWQSLNVVVNYFSTKYLKLSSICPSLPEHMKVQVHSMDELPCYTEGDEDGQGDEDCDEASESIRSLEETCKYVMIKFSSNYSFGTDEASYKHCGQFKQYGNEQPRDSTCLEVDWHQPFCLVSSLDTTSSTIHSNFTEATNESSWQRSKQFPTTVNADENQQPCPTQEQSTTAEVAIKDQKIIRCSTDVQDVEVVDLLTPSPNCRIMSCGKKMKISSISPVIIDLT